MTNHLYHMLSQRDVFWVVFWTRSIFLISALPEAKNSRVLDLPSWRSYLHIRHHLILGPLEWNLIHSWQFGMVPIVPINTLVPDHEVPWMSRAWFCIQFAGWWVTSGVLSWLVPCAHISSPLSSAWLLHFVPSEASWPTSCWCHTVVNCSSPGMRWQAHESV